MASIQSVDRLRESNSLFFSRETPQTYIYYRTHMNESSIIWKEDLWVKQVIKIKRFLATDKLYRLYYLNAYIFDIFMLELPIYRESYCLLRRKLIISTYFYFLSQSFWFYFGGAKSTDRKLSIILPEIWWKVDQVASISHVFQLLSSHCWDAFG